MPVCSQHAAGGQVHSVTGVERADKKDLQDFDNLFNKISRNKHGNQSFFPRSGKKEPDFRRYLFSQLPGMLAAENSHLSPSVKVDLC